MEENQNVTTAPAEVEQQLLQQQLPKEVDPVAAATMLFGLYIGRFCNNLEALSNKSLRRVIRALVAQPLEDLKPNLKNPLEKETYAIGEKLLEAKTTIVLDSIYKKHAEIQKAESEALEEKEQTNGEEKV